MRLKLNGHKTEYITFGCRIQLQKVPISSPIAGNDVIQMSTDVKYLGGILGNNLNFNKQITMKIDSHVKLHMHKGNVKIPSKQACTTLVLMLCILHLDCVNALLYGLPRKSINRFQRIQNMYNKVVLQCLKYSSTTEALMDLHWLLTEQ